LIPPLYLLADIPLLFFRGQDKGQEKDDRLPSRIRANLPASNPQAAYVGASNGDLPEFYELFVAAMQSMSISNCRSIPAQLSNEDRPFLEDADLILLAGGDVERGWRAFEQNGLKDLLLRKRYDGSTLIGVSAGAVQLGLGSLTDAPQPKKLDLFSFAPFYVGAHEEKEDWWNLRALVTLAQNGVRGIGIPSGAAAIYHSDGTLEPIRHPLIELLKENDQVTEHLLLPLEPTDVAAAPSRPAP
jgi:cyanophycinase